MWNEFIKFIKARAESRNILSLNAIAHFSYILVAIGQNSD
jgi:hypothetical protein